MRLDLFLKASRLCPRRSVAQKLCEAGLVTVGARPAKPAHLVHPGDEITISRRDRKMTILVKAMPHGRQTSREESFSLFDIVREEKVSEGLDTGVRGVRESRHS
ncbi:MAG TPA: S4 domain-containing protein [Pyrinomonadaceae bacterium]